MEPLKLVAQIIGIAAMAFNILSYQQKKQKTVIAFQLVGGALFTINYLMLGAVVGGIMNFIAVIRALVYMNKEKLKSDRFIWLLGFVLIYVVTYICNFTILGTKPTAFNLIIEVLPVIGMTATNVGFRMKNASDVRKCGLVASPCWLVYNVAVFSVGAIICEVLSLISIVTGMIRLDRKKEEV